MHPLPAALLATLALVAPATSTVEPPPTDTVAAATPVAPPAPVATQSVDVELVLVPVLILGPDGDPVAQLTREDFELRVDGRRTPIASFQNGDAPFAIAIVIDCSSSMVGAKFEAARTAAAALLSRLGRHDRALLIGFDHRVTTYATATSDQSVLRDALGSMRTGGGTSLYDALALAIRLLDSEPQRGAVVLLSDGEDALSRTSPAQIEQAARRSRIVLYSFAVDDLNRSERKLRNTGAPRMRDLALELGGRAFAPRTAGELVAGYEAVFDEMRLQYTLGFVPTERSRGRRFLPLEVRVADRTHKVRMRRGWLEAR